MPLFLFCSLMGMYLWWHFPCFCVPCISPLVQVSIVVFVSSCVCACVFSSFEKERRPQGRDFGQVDGPPYPDDPSRRMPQGQARDGQRPGVQDWSVAVSSCSCTPRRAQEIHILCQFVIFQLHASTAVPAKRQVPPTEAGRSRVFDTRKTCCSTVSSDAHDYESSPVSQSTSHSFLFTELRMPRASTTPPTSNPRTPTANWWTTRLSTATTPTATPASTKSQKTIQKTSRNRGSDCVTRATHTCAPVPSRSRTLHQAKIQRSCTTNKDAGPFLSFCGCQARVPRKCACGFCRDHCIISRCLVHHQGRSGSTSPGCISPLAPGCLVTCCFCSSLYPCSVCSSGEQWVQDLQCVVACLLGSFVQCASPTRMQQQPTHTPLSQSSLP